MADGNAGVNTVNDIVLRAEAEQAVVTALRDAYATIQGFTATDNRSWLHWSGYHGFDQHDCWHHDRTGPGPGNRVPLREPCSPTTCSSPGTGPTS